MIKLKNINHIFIFHSLPKESQLKFTGIHGSIFKNSWNNCIDQTSMADAGGWKYFKKNNPIKADGAAGALYREMEIKSFSSETQKNELGGTMAVC